MWSINVASKCHFGKVQKVFAFLHWVKVALPQYKILCSFEVLRSNCYFNESTYMLLAKVLKVLRQTCCVETSMVSQWDPVNPGCSCVRLQGACLSSHLFIPDAFLRWISVCCLWSFQKPTVRFRFSFTSRIFGLLSVGEDQHPGTWSCDPPSCSPPASSHPADRRRDRQVDDLLQPQVRFRFSLLLPDQFVSL